jgi:uncharacterized metal-binding protein
LTDAYKQIKEKHGQEIKEDLNKREKKQRDKEQQTPTITGGYEFMLHHFGIKKEGQRNYGDECKCLRNKIHGCPLNCSESQMNSKEVYLHLTKSCPLVGMKCTYCNTEFVRSKCLNHKSA